MAAQVSVLGIRHHGPGSARSVLSALEELQPEAVVIEGMPELERLLPLAGHPDLVPPVAGLVYVKDTPSRAVFSPMAVFSPEWVAMRWALARDVPVRFADLAAVHWLALEEDDGSGEEAPVRPHPEDLPVPTRRDPIARLAAAAGYGDPERWWDDVVEHRPGSGLAAFDALREAIAEVRADDEIDRETLLREASMRQVVRSVVRSGAERVAVVCGAYHAPVVAPATTTVSADAALLKGLPRVRVEATWAPWTAERLATASGYGAGVASPGWYAHLHSTWAGPRPDDVVPSWLVRVARQLRGEQLDAPTASVVEAARLADALGALRGRPSVGLEELTDATQAVLCEGSDLPLRLIHDDLVVGHELGSVPEDAPSVPLAADLTRQQRSLRLRVSATAQTVVLDLRTDAGRARSTLLHRLRLLGIDWGSEADAGRTTGTFKEAWELEWRPELAVAVIAASIYGTTVESAAAARVARLAEEAPDLSALASLVQACLLADLPGALGTVLEQLARQTALQHDTLALLGTVEPLARTARYGDVRGVDGSRVREILDAVVVRACVGLRAALTGLDDVAADVARTAVESAQHGIGLLDDETLLQPWHAALADLAGDDAVHGSLAGRLTRILLDSGRLGTDEAVVRMSQRLSPASPAAGGAAWLDGFLAGDAALLLHDDELLGIVDAWVGEIREETFEDLLPLLRRTFSRYERPARRQLGEHLQRLGSGGARRTGGLDLDVDRALPAVHRVAALIGLEGAR
ncbi:DUF5682 family protein [Ornithinimicrobium humiphilum]|uniref:Uncharacterized protein n=1 Tax=Ornithinimicrobium humiphilum TaxID=125288 RepID=A0A543KMC0_9MICO|nr:DUF5682 family protein [Ornithinimicrobium humiphilum]TQM96222.1 hypothetical protein FB476_1086 [Ornithinimicrobium humiphilum]